MPHTKNEIPISRRQYYIFHEVGSGDRLLIDSHSIVSVKEVLNGSLSGLHILLEYGHSYRVRETFNDLILILEKAKPRERETNHDHPRKMASSRDP